MSLIRIVTWWWAFFCRKWWRNFWVYALDNCCLRACAHNNFQITSVAKRFKFFFLCISFVLNSHFFLHLTHSIVWWDYDLVCIAIYIQRGWRKKESCTRTIVFTTSILYFIFFCCWGNFLNAHFLLNSLEVEWKKKKLETHVHSFEFTLSANSIINC